MDSRPDTPAEPRGATLGVFLVALLCSAYFFNGGGQNQNVNFDLARALVEHGSICIDDYRDNTIDVSWVAGHFYSNKAPGVSFLAAIPYAAIHALMGRAPAPGLELTLVQYLCTVASCALLAAMIAAMIFREGLRRGVNARFSLACGLVAVIGTPVLAYSSMLFMHVPNALLVFAAFLFVFRREDPNALLAGFAIGIGVTMNYLVLPVVAILGVALLARSASRIRDGALYAAGALPGLFALGLYQKLAFGGWLRTSVESTKTEFLTQGAFLGVIRPPRLDALWGLTFSPYRGLFFLSPFLLVALAGAWTLLKDRRYRAEAIASLATILYFTLIGASFNGWHGGYTVGPRYLIPIIPLVALFALHVPHRLRGAVLALAALSALLNIAVTAVDPQTPETLRNPVAEYILPTFITGVPPADPRVPWLHDWFTGHVGVSRLTVSERQVFRKFPPGSPETEWAAFNLGEIVFPVGSLASLLPLAILSGIGVVWLWRRCGG